MLRILICGFSPGPPAFIPESHWEIAQRPPSFMHPTSTSFCVKNHALFKATALQGRRLVVSDVDTFLPSFDREKEGFNSPSDLYVPHCIAKTYILAFILTLWPKGIQQIILNINFKDYCYVIPGSGDMNLALFSLKCNMCIIKDWRPGVWDASWKSGVSKIFGFPTLCGMSYDMFLDTTHCPASPPWALVPGDSTPRSGELWSVSYLQCGHSLVQDTKWICEWHRIWLSDLGRVVWCRRDRPRKKAMAFPHDLPSLIRSEAPQSRQMCVKGHLAICDPMRGSLPRVDEVHFNP